MTDTKDVGTNADPNLDFTETLGAHPVGTVAGKAAAEPVDPTAEEEVRETDPMPRSKLPKGNHELGLESAKDAMRNPSQRLEAIERAVHPEESNRDGR